MPHGLTHLNCCPFPPFSCVTCSLLLLLPSTSHAQKLGDLWAYLVLSTAGITFSSLGWLPPVPVARAFSRSVWSVLLRSLLLALCIRVGDRAWVGGCHCVLLASVVTIILHQCAAPLPALASKPAVFW